MWKRVKRLSSKGVLNVIRLKQVANTKWDRIFMVSLAVKLAKRPDSNIPMPINQRVLLGMRRPFLFTLKTPRNIFRAQRWSSLV